MEQRFSDDDISRRDIPSFIEPRPPLINNPFMRPRPQKGTNLLELFDQDSEIVDPELVQVYLRVKPCYEPNNLYDVRSDTCLVTSFDTTTAGHGRRTQHNVSRMYTFSQIFGSKSSQKEIFEQVVRDNLKKLLDGHSFTLLTYGASGSGKTYTLMGTVNAPGLVPRSLEYVFMLVDASQQPKYKPSESGADRLGHSQQEFELQWVKNLRQVSVPQRNKYRRMSVQLTNDMTVSNIDLTNRTKHYVWVSFVEIYNEAIYDLLAPPEKRTKLRIREDSSGQVYVKGVTQAFVRSGVEAYDVMVAGKHNLVVAATGVHAHSSRSHCIFTITLLTETENGIRTSCIRLCDLAGCERARATRNTGTRMQESRAINSSLHVLERCLHMLRRNQRQRQEVLVPYRESKLTRLLGSGLSGSRGEAVSMVVTLNPSPRYAQETKHVLSLAAVAQDIQINDQTTMFMSTLESSATQDTTITSSAEVMKLRSDNELLHFELVQAQARNKELAAAMEEKQEQAATMMRELVEEAKDMTKQYYEPQIQRLRDEMEEMIEEYEARLTKPAAPIPPVGTPPTYLQTKIAQLMKQIAVLQDELSKEKQARERAEAELGHLQTCLDERDEKNFNETDTGLKPDCYQDEFVFTDNTEDSTDIMNQSLEPVFRKECKKANDNGIHNRSAKVEPVKEVEETDTKQTDIDDDGPDDKLVFIDNAEDSTDIVNQSCLEPVFRKECRISKANDYGLLNRSVKVEPAKEVNVTDTKQIDIDDDGSDNSDYESGEETHVKNTVTEPKNISDSFIEAHQSPCLQDKGTTNDNVDNKSIARGTYFVSKSSVVDSISVTSDDEANDLPELQKAKGQVRGTYYVSTTEIDSSISQTGNEVIKEDVLEKARPEIKEVKGTYIVSSSMIDSTNAKKSDNVEEIESHFGEDIEQNKGPNESVEVSGCQVNFGSTSVADSTKADNIDDSGDNEYVLSGKSKTLSYFVDKIKQDKGPYNSVEFKSEVRGTYFVSADAITSICAEERDNVQEEPVYSVRTSAIDTSIDEEMQEINEHKTVLKKNTFSTPDKVESKEIKAASETFVSKIIKSLKKPTGNNSDNSLAQFEQLEFALNKCTDAWPAPVSAPGYFDDKSTAINTKPATEKRVYFDNIGGNIETGSKKLSDSSQVQSSSINTCEVSSNNTIDAFENIYKDLSTQRATEFELLASETDIGKPKNESEREIKTENYKEELKYNLRHKNKSVMNTSDDKKGQTEESLLERTAKCEKVKHKRSLRLRTHKPDDSSGRGDCKLKDILNLKQEFSDVTMGLPAVKKEVKDIPSPEPQPGAENLPPWGIQSCPSKSVTRSRRKLFTPRAEPLEECHSETGDSSERVHVPRPSYHRTRVRRKLN